jgi:DNA primase
MKDYLLGQGFTHEVDKILSPHILIHGSFALPRVSLDEAREGWKEIFNHIQNKLGQKDINEAQENLAEDMSPEAWHRLKALKKQTLLQY